MSVLLGNGDGTFISLPIQSTNGAHINSIAVADINGDGFLDLVLNDFGIIFQPGSQQTDQVVFGNGDGTFQKPQALLTGSSLDSVAVGDFNGDGRPDVVASSQGELQILLNQSGGSVAGSFGAASSAIMLPIFVSPQNVLVADMNGDGLPDVVASDFYNGSVYVYYNLGNGSFRQAAQNIAGQNNLGLAAVGDFDLDGGPDVMVPLFETSGAAVLLNRGTNEVQFSGVSVTGSGTHVIEAETQAGGVYTGGVSNTLSLTAAPVKAIVNLSTTPSTGITTNQQINATITVPTLDNFAPTGTVSLYRGSTLVKTSALSNGTVTIPVTFTAAGQTTLTATYNGDANLAASSTALILTVTAPPV